MNSTPRALNRFLLALLGIVLFAAGALTAWAGASPAVARQWTRAGQDTLDRITGQLRAAPVPGTGSSWWTAAAFLLLLLLVGLLVAWIATQGGGRTGSLGAHEDAGRGTTTVDVSFAAQSIRDATAQNRQLRSTTVSAWKIRGAHALRISVQARKGASPADISSALEEVISGLDAVLGEQIPVLVRIAAGPRTRFAHRERVR
ncbi:hypothetical protein [Arthrobacter sp. ZGTC131]|uniref:hypothetical protein n=1 Tax=Arthrobacter sp. ZGTC131 TaxID=2058898 RepID=UPI000CE55461|nr:hypothetical protein [Arthrobacter sp. ZGTC131]